MFDRVRAWWRGPIAALPPTPELYEVNALRPLKVVGIRRLPDGVIVELDDGSEVAGFVETAFRFR